MAAPKPPAILGFLIPLRPEQMEQFLLLEAKYGFPSDEALDFLIDTIKTEIEILSALEEKSHVRTH